MLQKKYFIILSILVIILSLYLFLTFSDKSFKIQGKIQDEYFQNVEDNKLIGTI